MRIVRLTGRLLSLGLLVAWAALTLWVIARTWLTGERLIVVETGSTAALAWLLSMPAAWVIAWSLRSTQNTEAAFYRTLAEKTSDAMMVYAPGGDILWRNGAARALFPEQAPLPASITALATRANQRKHVLTQVVPVDGAGRYSIQAVPVPNGHTALIIRTGSGETGRSTFYENFIRRIVHDMRNPLAAIIGHAANLRGVTSPEPEQVTRAAETIEHEAQRLARLVDSMLFDARLAYVPLAPEPLDLIELVEEAVYTLEDRALTAGKHIGLEMPTTTALIEGDRDLLTRAFENLLDNSLKYTDADGRIIVRLNEQPGAFHLAFIDNGSGIPPEYLPNRIFEPLVRANPGPGGSGLGLSIVKKIVEMHGGTIRAESQLNKGTAINVHLPRNLGGHP